MRRLFLLTFTLLLLFSFASADEYFELKPGFVTTLAYEGIGLYSLPSYDARTDLRIGSGVCMLLKEIEDNGWAAITFLRDGCPMEGYVRTASLVMNDYGIGYDAVRIVSDTPNQPINFYKQPNEQSQVYGQYFTGTLVTLYEVCSNGFSRIAIGNKTGYILSKYLYPYNSSGDSALPEATICASTDNGTTLTVSNHYNAAHILDPKCHYPNGTDVIVLGITPDNWCHVMINGRTGYIYHEELQPTLTYINRKD